MRIPPGPTLQGIRVLAIGEACAAKAAIPARQAATARTFQDRLS